MSVSIRKAVAEDASSLSHICLVTADAGQSAETLHDHAELPGLVFAVPYVHLPTTWAFVLTDSARNDPVVGYIVGSTDTRAFEANAKQDWWPPLADKYPPSDMVRKADKRYANLLRNMFVADDGNIKFSPAHLHINILKEYQGKGWGRKLIQRAADHLKGEGLKAVWLGMDPRNLEARKFYLRVGFMQFEGASENALGMVFEKDVI